MSGNVYRYTLIVEGNEYEQMSALLTLAKEIGETTWHVKDDEEYDRLVELARSVVVPQPKEAQ